MPSNSPSVAKAAAKKLAALGQQVRLHRKTLRVSATAAAEAAGMSRVTLHRIEKGEPSVTMGAYLNALVALGLNFGIVQPPPIANNTVVDDKTGWIPARIRLGDYPQLKQIAWQLQGADALTPAEALSVYERNWRHVDVLTLTPREQQLIDALRLAFGAGRGGKESDGHGDV